MNIIRDERRPYGLGGWSDDLEDSLCTQVSIGSTFLGKSTNFQVGTYRMVLLQM